MDTRFELSGRQTIRTVEKTANRLRDHMLAHDRTLIDVEGVTEIDVSLIQLLLSARKFAQATGRHIGLSAPAVGPLLACLKAGGFLPEQPGEVRGAFDFWTQGGE